MQVIKIEKDALQKYLTVYGVSVLIQDGNIKSWVDVWVDEGELRYDWNKYIFFKGDGGIREWQDSADNFMEATDLAVETSVREGYISQDEQAQWHLKI